MIRADALLRRQIAEYVTMQMIVASRAFSYLGPCGLAVFFRILLEPESRSTIERNVQRLTRLDISE